MHTMPNPLFGGTVDVRHVPRCRYIVLRLSLADATAARNQLSDQLADARRQHSRSVEEASGQEEMYKARMQQLEVRAVRPLTSSVLHSCSTATLA